MVGGITTTRLIATFCNCFHRSPLQLLPVIMWIIYYARKYVTLALEADPAVENAVLIIAGDAIVTIMVGEAMKPDHAHHPNASATTDLLIWTAPSMIMESHTVPAGQKISDAMATNCTCEMSIITLLV